MSGYDTCSPRCPGHLWLLLRPNSPVVVETLGTGETGLMYHYFIWDDPPPARCVYFQPLIPLDPQTQLQGWSDSTTNRALAEATRVQTLVPLSTETSWALLSTARSGFPSMIAKNRVQSRYLSAKKSPLLPDEGAEGCLPAYFPTHRPPTLCPVKPLFPSPAGIKPTNLIFWRKPEGERLRNTDKHSLYWATHEFPLVREVDWQCVKYHRNLTDWE